eukprot:TRINITY_DN71938_c0_g1_i1.p1 TRINITY_DN71938_c0_g1~~TRINITY_DN71938_c0_g1_i1.p1  ORF type:complete len:609 (-),score=66.95 TRINITY_DN71938_c0_g1_i1:162-1988(-)
MGLLWLKVSNRAMMRTVYPKLPSFFAFGLYAGPWISLAQTYAFQTAMRLRVELLEHSFGTRLGSRYIRRLGLFTVTFGLLLSLGTTAGNLVTLRDRVIGLTIAGFSDGSFQALRVVTMLLIALAINSALGVVSDALDVSLDRRSGYLYAEARWALVIMNRLRWGCVLPCACTSLFYLIYSVYTFGIVAESHRIFVFNGSEVLLAHYEIMVCVVETLNLIVEVLCLLVTVGFFQKKRPNVKLSKASTRIVSTGSKIKDSAWVATVNALSERSLRVSDLLQFYSQLGSPIGAMPSFNPQHSTTNDVVRQAIIPLSRIGPGGGVAYTEVVEPGVRSVATCMVSHSWSSSFVQLVAAIVADALSLREYRPIMEMLLRRQFAPLQFRLQKKGVSSLRYWICCFCVNQHSSICGGFGTEPAESSIAWVHWDRGRRDSVTKALFEACHCGVPKKFNDAPDCELNKFSEMMMRIRDKETNFRQLIVVDEGAHLFGRVWCVAEMVEAYYSGMPQTVMMLSPDVLLDGAEDVAIYERLATLDVAECEASRAEDKEDILAGIPDIEEFNATLQGLIFAEHGLLGQHLSGFGVIEAAAQVARRVAGVQRNGAGDDDEAKE